MTSRWQEALFCAESNYGRDAGWEFVCDGSVVGELFFIRNADMFWDEYRFTTNDPEWHRRFSSNEFWWKEIFGMRCTFRSKGIDREALDVMVTYVESSGLLQARRLYVPAPDLLVRIARLTVLLRRAFRGRASDD